MGKKVPTNLKKGKISDDKEHARAEEIEKRRKQKEMKKLKNKMENKTNKTLYRIVPVVFILVIIAVWQVVCKLGLVPKFMLPSPSEIAVTFVKEFPLLWEHMWTTLLEAFIGLGIAVALGFIFAFLMDRFELVHKCLYPLMVITQTIPSVAIAPLLVLWFGYEMLPKIILIVIVCFFPIAVNWFEGFQSVERDVLRLMRTMKASEWQIFKLVKFKAGLSGFFSGLKIAVSYAIVGGVIAEWLGGANGLGVYMTQVRKSFAYDKMFAVIVLVSLISLLLIAVVNIIKTVCMPWERVTRSK